MTRHPVTRWLLATALMLFMSLGWALPTPKDIESALNAGQTAQAESMLREVLKEKPQSAKAHYELGQVLAREGRYEASLGELRLAQSIDPSLKFAHSTEQFQRIVAEVEQLKGQSAQVARAATPTAAASAPAPAHPEPALQLSTVWWGIGLLFVVGLVIFMRRPKPTPVQVYAPAAEPPRGFGAGFNPGGPAAGGYGPGGYGPGGYAAPASGGSTVAGAVVGGLAGVAAGYALSKALEGEHHGDGTAQAANLPRDNGGYVPFDQPAARPEMDAFDPGSGGESWDSGDSSGGDNDW
jgi:tetratricopeptide (TPR) repeat protein